MCYLLIDNNWVLTVGQETINILSDYARIIVYGGAEVEYKINSDHTKNVPVLKNTTSFKISSRFYKIHQTPLEKLLTILAVRSITPKFISKDFLIQ
jgi:hypothetical protein